MPAKMYSSLTIRQLILPVFLGYFDAERAKTQPVKFDIKLMFASTPISCQTDHLEDTTCYDALITALKKYIKHKKYNLIEHLGADIYQFLKTKTSHPVSLRVVKQPVIPDFSGDVVFYYGEHNESW